MKDDRIKDLIELIVIGLILMITLRFGYLGAGHAFNYLFSKEKIHE